MQPDEKIVSCCWLVKDGTTIPVDETQLPMDALNDALRERPEIFADIAYDETFITSTGRYVDRRTAFHIAVNSGQLLNDDATGKTFSILDIRPSRKHR